MEDLLMKPNRMVRSQIIECLRERDGWICFLCKIPFKEDDQPTIDHWYPLAAGGTWHIENLRLSHSLCNARKGSIIPNADGTITYPKRERSVKVRKPEVCGHCMSGRILLFGEICDACGSGPQPVSFPTANKKKTKNCTHSGLDHCWNCVLGWVKRND